jgi:hypothetical protein
MFIPLMLLSVWSLGCGEAPSSAPPSWEIAGPVWQETKPMGAARTEHVAVAMADSRVLVAGGAGANGVTLASAEIFDPGTGEWTPAGAMHHARAAFAATLLPSGEVLVSGGYDEQAGSKRKFLASAELYDPVSGSWTETMPMARAHVRSTSTLLSSGLVLVVGGRGTSAVDIAELYDPASHLWTLTDDQPAAAHHQHTATLLADGRVLISGGYDPYAPLDGAELFEPDGDTFAAASSMGIQRTAHVALRLTHGSEADKVLVVGGTSLEGQVLRDTELFDPANDAWKPGPGSLNEARSYNTAFELDDGEVVVAGGTTVSGVGPDHITFTTLDSTEAREPGSGAWTQLPGMHVARGAHTMTQLRGSVALVTGGVGGDAAMLASAEIFYRNGPCTSNLDCSRDLVCSPARVCAARIESATP